MIVQAEVSLYPLGREHLSGPIGEFLRVIEEKNLQIETGPMSSIVTGENADVFDALGKAFGRICESGPAVLCIKVSNACPRPEGKGER